jgi:glycosyltransferase involved in cell wall biosynthesis
MRSYGGGEKYLIELSRRLKNFDITIFSYLDTKNAHIGIEKVKKMSKAKIKFFKSFSLPILKERLPLTISGISLLLELDKYDSIYITDPSMPTIFMILLFLKLRRAKAKVIFGVHDPGFLRDMPQKNNLLRRFLLKFYKPIYKLVLFKIPNIHVLNEEDEKKLRVEGYNGKIYFIPNFLYYNKPSIKIYENKERFVVLFGGRLAIYHKGIDLLVNIIENVLSRNRNIEFHIFGSGEDGQEIINNLAKEYPKNVKYLGFIPNEKLEEEYKKSSLFIMTSRIESFPLVTLEAQAHGLPVVAFNIKGPNEILKKSFQGSLIEPFDTNLFSEQIIKYYKLWKNGRLNKEYKSKIKSYIFSKYSDKVIIPRLERMLK